MNLPRSSGFAVEDGALNLKDAFGNWGETLNIQHSTSNIECFPRQRRAFTLIELMIVVAIIGIMTAMILPQITGTYEEALLRSTSRDLISAVNLASSRAVSFNQPYRLRLDRESSEYRVEKRVRNEGREEFAPLPDVAGSAGKLDSRITVEIRSPEEASPEQQAAPLNPEVPDDVVTFFSDGTADAKEVRLQDRQGFRLALSINPTTARVRVVELPRE